MRKLLLLFLLWGGCVSSFAQVNAYSDRARLQDFARQLTGGIERLEQQMDAFSARTGLHIYIVTAYKYNQPDINRLAAEWPQKGKGLLLGLNLHEEGNWSQHLQIAYTPEVTAKIPAEQIEQVRNLVLVPLLEGREISVADGFGGTTKVSFAGQGKYYLTLEQGIAALLGAFGGTPLGAVPAIAFAPATEARYGFDAKSKEALAQYYDKGRNELTGKDEYVPWKAIEAGKTDVVEVVSPSRSSRAELAKIQFNSPTGIVPASPVANDRLQLTLQGAGRADNTQEISAYYPTGDNSGYTVARLNVVTYEKLPKHLVIVPLAGTTGVPTGPEIREVLNKIYGQAVAEWSVEVAPAFDAGNWDGNGNGKVEMGNSGLLSNYTAEMRAINRAFKNNTPAYGEDTYYLFLVNQSENAATLGYMPRAKQFGYVFTQAVMRTGQNVPQVIAHELGHGAFHLKHTFEETSVAKGSSTNVMDYPSGTTLNKYQWDLVHDPVRVVGLLEDDEEGAMKIDWTLLDKKYTLLLNHVYDKNHLGSLTYMDKILTARSSNNVEKTMELDYEDDEEQEWVKQWKLRTSTSDEILEKIIGKIQSTQKGVKIPKTTLYEKGIYIGTYNYEETEYPIAIYSEKAVISNLVKVQVNEVEELDEAENKRHLKCEETLIKYMILAFYESGETAPSLIMQIEKFDFSKLENTKEKWLSFLNILNTPAEPIAEANPSAEKQDSSPNSKASFPVTGEQLKLIFPPTSQERLNAVAAVINKYSNDFEITTPLRMAHFLGQIGAETGGLKKLNEDDCYREKGIKTTFGKKKYCDLFEGYEATTQTECPNKKLPGCEPELEDPFELDKLTVKKKYICSSSLFDYVYACRMDNGAPSTKDGSTYKGKGFIHLTGKDQYTAISVEWNKLYPNDKKEFHKNDINLLVEDLDVAMKASLIYWKTKKFNKIADNGIDEDNIDKIGKKVNGSGSNLPNGYKERRSYAKLAYTVISPK